jgi:hypothetical protein
MNNLYARSVFFVKNAERALRFYMESLGFSEDWNYQEEGRTFMCQVRSSLGCLRMTLPDFGITAAERVHF